MSGQESSEPAPASASEGAKTDAPTEAPTQTPDPAAEQARAARAEEVLATALAESPEGAVDVAELCRAHPELAAELLELAPVLGALIDVFDAGLGDARGPRPEPHDGPTLAPPSGGAPPAVHGGASSAAASVAVTSEVLERLRDANAERYVEQGEVARGGMGAILGVWDPLLRRRLAMKVALGRRAVRASEVVDELHHASAEELDERTLGRFLEEAQVTGQLDHPGIVPVHELGLDARGRLYFTMPLVRGRTLKQVLHELALAERHGAAASTPEPEWTRERALGVLQRVCEAMAYAHSKGVLHRDLKPSNVMVGRFGQVYVMDWGLARVQGRTETRDLRIRGGVLDGDERSVSRVRTERAVRAEEGSDAPLYTMDGDVVGTPAYMAPEQARGELAEMGPATDVYAVGAMLYQLLTGGAPYLRADDLLGPRAIWFKVIEGPPAPAERFAPDAPPELLAICARAMQRESGARYPDMQALSEDLRAYLEGRAVSAHATGAWVEAKKWARRNRAVAASLAALALVALLFGSAALVQARARGALATRAAELYARRAAADLVQEGRRGWPLSPAARPDVERWLAEARDVAQRLPAARRELAALEAALAAVAVPNPAARRSHRARRYRDRAEDLRATLAKIEAGEPLPWPEDESGELDDVVPAELDVLARLARFEEMSAADPQATFPDARASEHLALAGFVRDVALLTDAEVGLAARAREALARIDEVAQLADDEAWEAARAQVAANEAYGGWELPFVPGLVPLGEDERSGLLELWHVASGARPRMGDDGSWVVAGETGIVLVLIPGATVSADGRDVELAPFLLSKYELTKDQWLRATGVRPSEHHVGQKLPGEPVVSGAHPVEHVTWFECEAVLERWGLAFPTELQWERAAHGNADPAAPYGVYGPWEDARELVNSSVQYSRPGVDGFPGDRAGRRARAERLWPVPHPRERGGVVPGPLRGGHERPRA